MTKIAIKDRMLQYYELHEKRLNISFFLGGFVFDIFTLSEVNDPISITQQVLYLFLTGLILFYEYSLPHDYEPKTKSFKFFWGSALSFNFKQNLTINIL